ncbi:hypothetical protein [Hoeflea alexandrii]
MQRVNLLQYFELAQAIGNAKRAFATDKTKAGNIYFGGAQIHGPLQNFITTEDGFSACKHVARAILEAIDEFNANHLMTSDGLDFEKLDTDVASWQWSRLTREVDAFIAVFTAECRDLEMYSVGQIGIYNMNALVSKGSQRFPPEFQALMPSDALTEFDDAGRCLAFNLPTACGFHSIRGLELCILSYLSKRMPDVKKLKSWHDYLQQIERLAKELDEPKKPSNKIAPMIQRMKDLDRNPLMHPQDNLDIAGADQLFNLASITAIELAKDDARMARGQLPATENPSEGNTVDDTEAA